MELLGILSYERNQYKLITEDLEACFGYYKSVVQ